MKAGRAAVFNNELAPPGWCEIQADDEANEARVSDEDVAEELAASVGLPHTAMQYNTRTRAMIPVHLSTAEAVEAIEQITYVNPGSVLLCAWIAIVPVEVALQAGLINETQATDALENWT